MLKPDTDSTGPVAGRDHSMRVERKSLTLRERAADVIRQAIIDHRLPPGKHLKERELCEMLGVSRTSVREALRHLESEHLIETVAHRGPVVVSLSIEDAKELYQVRSSLEGLAGELFARHATDEHIRNLRKTAEEMADAVARDHSEATLIEIIERFYEVLLDGSQSKVCAQFIRSLNTRISMFRRVGLNDAERRSGMMNDIDEIVRAAEERNAGALKQACIRHVERAGAIVMQQLNG